MVIKLFAKVVKKSKNKLNNKLQKKQIHRANVTRNKTWAITFRFKKQKNHGMNMILKKKNRKTR